MGKEKTRAIAEKFAEKLDKKFRLEFAVLFGSRARGDYLEDSDYDLLVVSNEFEGLNVFERIKKVNELWKENNSLEPICFTRREFEEKLRTFNAITHEALRHGKCVWNKKTFAAYEKKFREAVKQGKITLKEGITFNIPPEEVFA